MSQENVEVVRRANEAWNRRDWITLSALWRSDGVLDWSRARGPFKGVYRGEGEREAFFDEFWSTFQYVQLETYDVTEVGSNVVISNTAHAGPRWDPGEREEHVGVHGRERADHSPSDVPRTSRGPRSRRAAGV